jgi:hypothetical protein
MIDRQLLLAEVQRFPHRSRVRPPSIAELTQLKTRRRPAGGPDAVDWTHREERIREIARDNLRILDYLDQRFGTTVQVSDEEVARTYREHERSSRAGSPIPFDEGEPAGAAARGERRRVTIDQWLRDLRSPRRHRESNPSARTP